MKVSTVSLFLLRFYFSWTFLWAFFDKLLGLSYSTSQDNAWVAGASPTKEFLSSATEGKVFHHIFSSLAGNPFIDFIFMFGLLFIGICLLLGIFSKISGYGITAMTLLMFLSLFPPSANPLTDEHIIYAIGGLILASSKIGEVFGLGKMWKKNELVKKYPILL